VYLFQSRTGLISQHANDAAGSGAGASARYAWEGGLFVMGVPPGEGGDLIVFGFFALTVGSAGAWARCGGGLYVKGGGGEEVQCVDWCGWVVCM